MHSIVPLRRLSWLASGLALFAVALASPGRGDAEPNNERSVVEASPLAQRAQHLVRLGATRGHAEGHRGRGITVAVLDSGFRGYRDYLGKSLPARVTVRSFRADRNLEARDSQHGILCAEVVHAIAPEAELLFANWEPDHPEAFIEAVRWARDQGARIITCSVIMPSYSDGEGGGPVHEALARALGTGGNRGDLLCFASAGNTAQRHWAGRYRPGRDGWHEWEAGQPDNRLSPWGGERVSVELCCTGGAAYDLVIRDADTGAEVARSLAKDRPARGSAQVRFEPQPHKRYTVRVRLAQGRPGAFHVVALHSGLEVTTSRGSIAFPADGPDVIAVGAVDRDGRRASYSSCGPNSSRPKPDLVAPVPFPSLSRSRPFAGTSAAAPQAAGLAALCWARHPDWTAGHVRRALQTAARDLGPAGHDWETGYGMAQLP